MARTATLLSVVALILIGTPALAQDGRIYGVVSDNTGSLLPGVTVTVRHSGSGHTQVRLTDSSGSYEARALAPGAYAVQAELQGFKSVTISDIQVGLEVTVEVNVVLEIGALQEAITVTATVPLLDARQIEIGGNISENQIKTLPVPSRHWIDLAVLLPGTGQDAVRRDLYNGVNIGSGITWYSNGYYVDGMGNNQQDQGEARQDFPQDAIAEFRVHSSNAPVMYGGVQGGILTAVTKSGTNQYRGSLFEFFRSKALTSKRAFEEEVPDYHRHQVGGSLGGPVMRDSAHFFGAVEYTTEANFFTVNTDGVFPEEEGTFESPYWNYMIVGRYDQRINNRHRLFARYAWQEDLRDFAFAGGTSARSTGAAFGQPRTGIVAGETWIIGDKTINEFRFQFARTKYQGWPSVPGLRWTEAGEFPLERAASIPDEIIRPSLTTGTSTSYIGPENRYNFRNDFSYMAGRHEFTFGADLDWIWYLDDDMDGRHFSFDTDAPFDPENPATFPFLFEQRLGPRAVEVPSTEHAVYVEDRWSIGERLTLNLGLRYDRQTGVFNEDLFDEGVREIRLGDRVTQPGGALNPALLPFYDPSNRGDNNNFGPRVGFAWNIAGDGQQLLHGAYGIHHNRLRPGAISLGERYPQAFRVSIDNPSYPDPYQGRDPFEFAAAVPILNIQGNNVRNPYAHQYSLGYDQQLGRNLAVSIAATFADGRNQHTRIDRNYFATPEDRAAGLRPLPQFGRVLEARTDGKSRYRAMELRVNRRLAGRWQLLGSYTLSSMKQDLTGFPESDAADPFNLDDEFGFSLADRRHRVVVSGIAELGRGWQVSSILRYLSSRPVNVLAGRDLNQDGFNTDRPTGVTRNQGCRGLNLDFVNQYRAGSGLEPVSGITCPDYLTVDARLVKNISFGSNRGLEAIVQAFNVFNRTNFGVPVGNARSPSFGRSLSALEPRQVELALRFTF